MNNLTLGLSTTAIGMLVVFFGLAILIGCIYLLTAITRRGKKEQPKKEAEAAPAVQEAPEAEDETDDSELVAVISAAIAAVWDKQSSTFVVRRVRRVQPAARAHAARDEQIYSRF